MRSFILGSIFLALSATCSCQQAKDVTFHGTLPQALLFVDQTFHVSVLGELMYPLPSNISLRLDSASTAQTVIASIVQQCPGYLSSKHNGVFLVVQKNLLGDPHNPMNQVLRSYKIPSNLSQFKLTFPSAVGAAEQQVPGSGGMVNGFSLAESVSPPLTPVDLHNLTAREILLHVAHEVGNLYSVLILSNAQSAKRKEENTAFLHWELAGGKGLANYRSHLTVHPKQSTP